MADSPRYQVFISSTYKDLKTARAEVQDAILRLKHFPIGMELLPATGDTPWELIKQVIAESDYYVLIIGGRYGSTDSNGISFTEREYDLAVELDKRILPFVHADPGKMPREDTDTDAAAWDKLCAFRRKVMGKHHCNDWHNSEQLKSKLIISLVEEITRHPMQGWIRSNGIDTEVLLRRLADLQMRYDQQEKELARLKQVAETTDSQLSLIQSFNDEVALAVLIGNTGRYIQCCMTVGELFLQIGPEIVSLADTAKIDAVITLYCGSQIEYGIWEYEGIGKQECDSMAIDNVERAKVAVEFLARKIIRIDVREFPPASYFVGPRNANERTHRECWQLTEEGARLLRVLQSASPSPTPSPAPP